MGKLADIQQQDTYIDYTLHDAHDSYSIKVREFKEDTQSDTGLQIGALYETFVERRTFSGEYVRVYGRLRFFDNSPSIIVFRVKQLISPKELELHAAEVRMAKLFWQKVRVLHLQFILYFFSGHRQSYQ